MPISTRHRHHVMDRCSNACAGRAQALLLTCAQTAGPPTAGILSSIRTRAGVRPGRKPSLRHLNASSMWFNKALVAQALENLVIRSRRSRSVSPKRFRDSRKVKMSALPRRMVPMRALDEAPKPFRRCHIMCDQVPACSAKMLQDQMESLKDCNSARTSAKLTKQHYGTSWIASQHDVRRGSQ